MKLSDEQIQRLNDSGFKWSLRESFLTSASMISWLSKQSMVIVMFLVLVRMCRLGDGVINWEFHIRKSKTIRASQTWNYLMNRFNAWTIQVSSGLFMNSFLTSASMISWLSKQSMVIMMFLVLVRMCRLGDGAVHWEFRIRKSKTIRSQKWNYLMNRFDAWTMRVSSGDGKIHFRVVCVCIFICVMGAKFVGRRSFCKAIDCTKYFCSHYIWVCTSTGPNLFAYFYSRSRHMWVGCAGAEESASDLPKRFGSACLSKRR